MTIFVVVGSGVLALPICKRLYDLYYGKIIGIPEPSGSLVVGHLFRLGDHFAETFLRWKKDLGPVFQIRILNQRALIFNDKASIKKVCSMRQASGRPQTSAFDYFTRQFGLGIASGEGPFQHEQREFYLKSLPRFGDTRHRFEDCITVELEELIFKWAVGAELELEAACSGLVLNSFLSVVADTRLEEERVEKLLSGFDKMMDLSSMTKKFVFAFTGLVEKVSPKLVKETFSGVIDIVEMTKEILDKNQKDRWSEQPRNMIDKMLDKMDATTDPSSVFHQNHYNAGLGLHEIIEATVETTSKTLEWFMLYMTQYPDVLARIRSEIRATYGDGNAEVNPRLWHQEKMPYVQACILETFRLSSVFPLGVVHRAIEDFELNGSIIPEGTLLVMNSYAVHHDEETWQRPSVFDPSRFLTQDGEIDPIAKAKILPFGSGRRMCIGSKMAEDIFFLFIVSVYSKLDFQLTRPLESMRGKFGVTVPPPKAFLKATLIENV